MFAGLAVRIAAAAAAGLRTPANVPVATGPEVRGALAALLCNAPNAATALGNHHDLFQFLPAHHRDAKLNELLMAHPWIRSRGGGAPGAAAWPDVVHYCQVITITRANAAVGPVDCPVYFNM